MPAKKRYKTKYAGVYYINSSSGQTGKAEKVYYIMFRKNGKLVEEKVGRQYEDDMTPSRASGIRAQKIEGKMLPNKQEREKLEKIKLAEEGRWTIGRLFAEYIDNRDLGKGRNIDVSRYNKYLKPKFAHKEPKELVALDVDRVRKNLLKKLSPQTVKHVLNLLTWTINFGVKRGLCQGISFHIQKPMVNNTKTEDLTTEQLTRLLEAIAHADNKIAADMMLTALYTGMRRGEMFKLQWKDIDFDRGFINIRDPKGGPDQIIPLNDEARGVFESIQRSDTPYVFPGRGGRQRTQISKGVNPIKKAAGLPKDFRPLHGLRHVYASMRNMSIKMRHIFHKIKLELTRSLFVLVY
jgi:integrase